MKRAFALLAAALAVGQLSAEPQAAERFAGIREALPRDVADELIGRREIQKTSYGKGVTGLKIAPSLPIVSSSPELIPFPDATYVSETLYLYEKKNATEPGADVGRVSAILRSISRLQGVEYYSNSRKKMWVLYETSYAVDGPASKKKIEDPVTGSGDGKSVFAVQKDTTFGEYLYRYDYRQTADSVAFFSRNLETMRFGFVKIIDSERFRASLVVRDYGDCLLVYGVTYANLAYVPAIGNKLNASFTARADAMYRWFVKEYER